MTDDRTVVHVAVRDCLADLAGPVDPGPSADKALVLVACSGGPDSLTLAAATVTTARAHGLRAGAVVVDHGWSPEASAAGHRAADHCRELGLDPVLTIAVNTRGPGGPEAAARTARYRALEEAAERTGARAVLLGHTLDDQAETVLLGLGRGSGARSLAGMPGRRGVFRRPLLGVRRAVVARAGAALGLHPWHDPANDDPAFTRVRVRRLADDLEQALGPGAVAALARSADLLRADADALDALAADLARAVTAGEPTASADSPERVDAPGCVGALDRVGGSDGGGGSDGVGDRLRSVRADPGEVLLDPLPLVAALPAVRRRALLVLARRAGCPGGSLTHRHALALERLVLTGRGQVCLPGDIRAQAGSSQAGAGARVSLRRRIVAG